MKVRAYPSFTDRKNKLRLLMVGVPILLLALVVSYLLFGGSPDRSATLEEKLDTVQPSPGQPRVAVIVPLSGLFAEDGEMFRKGMETALRETDQPGASVNFSFHDGNRPTPDLLELVRELAANRETVLVVAHLPVSQLTEIVPLCSRANLVVLVPAGSHQKLAGQAGILSFVPPDREDGLAAARTLKQAAAGKGVCIVSEESAYGRLLAEAFKEGAALEELEFQHAAHEEDNTRIEEGMKGTPVLTDCRGIFLAGSPLWGISMVRGLCESGFKGQVVLPRTFTREFLDDLPCNPEGGFIVLRPFVFDPEKNEKAKAFRSFFLRNVLREPDELAALGSDTACWVNSAMAGGSISRKNVRQSLVGKLTREEPQTGSIGTVWFDEGGRAQRSVQATVYREGRFRSIEGR